MLVLSQYEKAHGLSGQPNGFSIFFLTEMWERYGFYVIQTLLIFYLTDELHMGDKLSYVIVGSFTALCYINCIFGGMIADRFIGASRCVLYGGILLCVGYTLLSTHFGIYGLDVALAIISIGTGFVKPNISGLLANLYNGDEIRKENGYTLYYVGIYVGAIGGSFIGGYLQQSLGWSLAFLSSALGSILSVIIFVFGLYRFKLFDFRFPHVSIYNYVRAILSTILLMVVSAFVLQSDLFGTIYFVLVALTCMVFLLYTIISHRGIQRKRLIAYFILILLSVFYWGINFQQFFTISLCIARSGNLGLPASVFPAVESFGIIFFAPVITMVWKYFQQRGTNIEIPARFSLGFLFNALGFIIMAFGLWYAIQTGYDLTPIAIVVAYLLIAIGELSLSPTSLSMVTTLVPVRFTSAMMGISLLSIGFGGKLAGALAGDAIVSQKSLLVDFQVNYMHAFFNYFGISILMFVVVLLLNKHIKNLIKV